MKSLPVVLLLVATALGVPVPQDTALPSAADDIQCTNSRFKVNNIYQFKYEAFSLTNIEGTSEKGSGLRYRCDVQIEVPEPCKLVLNVNNCALRHLDDIVEKTKLGRHDTSKDFDAAISQYDIIAHVDNGIVRKVLAHPDEPKHITNIKKGIFNMVSLNFQEGSEDVVEIIAGPCLSGDCPATRRVLDRREGSETDVEVTKDLSKCKRRNIVGLSTSPLFLNMTVADKFITSNQTCLYELEWDNIKRVKCSESHVLWPFSHDATKGIRTEIFQDLKFSEKEKVNSVTPIRDEDTRRVTDLVYEPEDEEKVKETDPTYATEILRTLVKGSLEEIQMETPQLFSQFVGAIRRLNNESIHELYERAINCPLYYESCENNEPKVNLIKTFVYDALVQCGTLECFRTINTAIIEGEISKPIADFVLYTMAMRDYPELTLIDETLRVAFYNRTQSTFLPLSIMINNYWNKNESIRNERRLPDEIHNTVAFFSSIIGHDCSMPSNEIDGGEMAEHQRQVYLALKAIGNVGQPALHYDTSHYQKDEMMSTRLVRCAENKNVPRNISLAAVQAMRRFDIPNEIRDPLKRILLRTDEDVELRLAAYLMIMRSEPRDTDVGDILHMLSNEPITQVQAFIYSHLDNILESERQNVQELKNTIRTALNGQELPEDYPRDIRRLSRNIELSKVLNISQFDGIITYLNQTFNSSLFNNTIGQLLYMKKTIGGSVESNLIHNPETFWMRAAMLKTTLNLLGKEWEMFETGIDMQGFEPTLEAIFGPQGFFPDDILGSIFHTIDEKIIQVLRDLYNQIEPHVMDVVNAPVSEMPSVLTEKAKATTDYLYDKVNTKQKRSVTDSLQERINELTSLLPNSIHENIQNIHDEVAKMPLSPAASMYLRLLGHEVGFLTLNDVIGMIPKVNLSKDGLMQMAMKMMQKAQNGIDYNITKSFIFMDKEFILPTVIGLPIRCNLNGTTSVSLRLHARAGLQLPKVFVAGRIAPSGAVNMIGSMATEIPYYTKHAVMANATVYHASRLEGNVTIDGPHIKFNLNNTSPVNLFNSSTNFFLIDISGNMHYIPGVLQDRVENVKCVGDLADMNFLGIDLCTAYAYPNASSVEAAPRFPLTGPSSFNITLRNLHPDLKTFTWEAYYKQVKPSSSPIRSKRMIMRRSTTKPPTDIIDTVVLKFSAPCPHRKREISSVASFDRSKTELRYNFSIPEMNVTFFSGILNLTCPKTKVNGYQLVTNFTAGPKYNASVSLTLKNSTTVDKNNYTAVYNMSVMNLYSSVVAQYVHDPTFVIASANVTYYWDRETPVWRQLLWPFTNYSISPKNYRQDYIMLKSEKRETAKETQRDSILKLSVANQNFTVKSDIVKDDVYYNNDIMIDFENFYNTLRILNVTAKAENRPDKYNVKVSAARFGHGVFALWEKVQSGMDLNNTLTYGYEANKKEIAESFKAFQNEPSVMAWFGDSIYKTERISYNVSHVLCIRDEKVPDQKWQYMIHLNTSFPKPLSTERLNFSLSARLGNETMRTCNNYSYWMEYNTSVPFLWFHNAKMVQLVNGSNGIDFHYNDTTTELFTNRAVTIDNRGNYKWKTMNATWEFNLITPVYNYTLNTTMYNSTESGYVFDYSSVMNNSLLHVLNVTHGGNFSVAPKNISLIGVFWHPWIQANMTNVLQKHGPIQDFSIANIQAITTDIKNKAQILDVDGIRMIIGDLINKTLDSSFNLTNLIIVKTPWLGNLTLDHVTHFNFSMINHSMNFEVIRPSSNVGMLLNTSAFLNRTRLSAAINSSIIGNRFFNGSSNMSFVLRKADEGALAVDFVNNHRFISPIGNVSVNGTYNVHNMSRPWRFNNINGTFGYNISTPIVNSTLNSSFILDNFTNWIKFEGIKAALDHNLTTWGMQWNANGSFIVDEFRNLVNYSRINGSLMTDLRSCLANMSHSIAMDVKNMSGIFRFEKIGGNISQKVDSIFGKSFFNTGIDLDDVNSPWNFTRVNGSINYNMTSRFVNLTLTNLMELKEFTKLWKFGKINGTMLWMLNTSLANATLKHEVDFDNFTSPINFTRINVTLEHVLNSKLSNASLKQAYGIYGMSSYLTFDRANSSIKGEVKTPFINGSIAHEMDVQDMRGPFNMTFANVSLHAHTNCNLLNVTTTNGMEWNNMRGIFTFDRINGSHRLDVHTPIAKFNTFGELVFNEFAKLTEFQLVNVTGLVNTNSRLLNFTSRVGHEMHNFRSLFNFDRMQTDERTTVSNCLMNHTGETHLTFNNFRSMLNFDSISGNLIAKTKTFLGNTNQTYTFDLRNSRDLFDFDRLFGNANVVTESRWFNMTVDNNMDFNEFTDLFSFRSMNLFSNVDIKTPIVNTTHEMRLDDSDHRKMFYFNRIFANHMWTVDTPFTSYVTDSDVELLYFYEMFQFTKAHANNQMKFNSRLANFTSGHRYHLDNFISAFNFDRVVAGGSTNLTTVLGTHTSDIDVNFNNFRSFWNFDRISGDVESHFVSRHLNNSVVLGTEVSNHRDLFDFDSFVGNGNMLFNTKWYNATGNAGFGVHNVRKLFDFDRITTGGSVNVSTPIISTGSMAAIEFIDFRSLLNFSRIDTTGKMNVSSRWLNITSEGIYGLHNVSHIFVFDRMNTTGKINISTPIVKTNTLVGLEMHNVSNLWCFTRVNGTGIWNVSSRLLNITNEGKFGIHNVSKPWAFERINGSVNMNVSTPIVNTTSMAGVEFNNFTNLFNFSRINGTGNWNVSSRWLNMITEGEFGFHNLSRIFTFERINGSARMNLSTPFVNQSSMCGVEFNNFTSLFNFSRINGTGHMNVSSKWLNMTTGGELGLHNFSRIFAFDRINGSARMNLSTPFFNQSSMGGLEFHNFTSLFNFSRINGTAHMMLASRFLNVTSQGDIGFHNFSNLFMFERINSSVKINVSTPIVNASVIGGSEHHNFSSLFNFSRVNYSHAIDVKSKIGNFNVEGGIGFHNFSSFANYSLISGIHKINLTSCLLNMTAVNAVEVKNHTGLLWFERFNHTTLFNMSSPWHNMSANATSMVNNVTGLMIFERANGNLTTEFITRWVNVTSNSSVELIGFKSLFNFTKANSTFIVNVTTPIANSSLNASLLFDNITSWRHHKGINGSVVFLFRSPMLNTSVMSQMNMTNFTTFGQMFKVNHSLRIMEREVGLIFTERINNDHVLFNVTVPQLNGSLCALAELNKVGNVLNMSLFRQTKENVNITDLSWILMLNRSDVIYSNFTWNPETLHAIRALSGEALNKTINVTLIALNRTMTTVNETLAVARRVINATIHAVNYTYNYPLDSIKVVINGNLVEATISRLNATKMFLNQTVNSTIFYVNQTWHLMNFTSVNSTIESFVYAIKQTPLNVPIQFVNVTVRSIDFTSLNSTVDSILREINCARVNKTVIAFIKQVNNTVEFVGRKLNETIIFVNATAYKAVIFVKEKVNETFVFLNETWQEGNFTTVEATIDTIISALNRTRLNTTILFINNTWQQMNFTSLNSTVESLKNVVNFTSINATIERILEKVNFTNINETVYELLQMVNLTHLNETLMNYTNFIVTEIQRIAKNESHPINQFTIKYFNTTAYNLTLEVYPVVYNFTSKYYPVVRNFTLQVYEFGQNLTNKYYPVVYNFTVTYYPYVANYSMIAFNYTRNLTNIAFNLTKVYGEVLFNHSLVLYNRTANYTLRAYNLTSHYGLIAFNKTKNYTLWLIEYTTPHRELIFNYTLNMTNIALNKAVNYSLQAIEYTANKTEWAKEHHREYILYYIEVLSNMTDASSNRTEMIFNVTEKYLRRALNYTITMGKPVALELLELSKDPTSCVNEIPMRFYNKTIYMIGQQIGQKIMLDGLAIILKDDNTLNTYLKKITDMNSLELVMFLRSKGIEYKDYVRGNVTYFVNVTRSNITYWTNYTLEHAPMATLNLIGNATVKANSTVLWLNSTRSQPLNITIDQVKMYLNETVLEVVDFLNRTLNGTTDMLLNMTRNGLNKTIHYANQTLIFVNQTICYVRNTTVKVWKFMKEETPLVNMTIDFANKTLNFTLTYANKTLTLAWEYAKKGKNVSLVAIDYLKNKTEEIRNYTSDLNLEVLRAVVNLTKSYAQLSINYTKEYAKLGVEYVNGTMVGWLIRYYDIENIPFNIYNLTYTHLNNTPEYLRRASEFSKRLTVDALNTIGRLEDNSFAINISHPLNFTTFRKFPNLTNDQWLVVNDVTMKVSDYACKAREYYELAREISEEKYTMAKDYLLEMYELKKPFIEEKMNQLKAKYEELKVKVQELRERIPEYRQKIMEQYDDLVAQWPVYVEQLKGKVEELRNKLPTWEEIKEIPSKIKQAIDDILNNWPETYVEIRAKIVSLPAKYVELKNQLKTWIAELEFDIPTECQKLLDKLVEYPKIRTEVEKVCNNLPALRVEVEDKYEELKRYIEIARVYVEKQLEVLCEKIPTECEKIKEYWQTISAIDAPYVTQKLEEYIPETWEMAKTEAKEKWEAVKAKIEELTEQAKVKIEELKVKVEELKDKAIEKKDELKTKAIEIKDLIIEEYPNTIDHIHNLISQIKNMVEGTLNAIREQLNIYFDKYYPSLKKYVDQILAYIIGLRPVLDKEASAMIFGPLGVLTFDKKLYEFPGYRDPSCTYVLARDFVDRNFTLLSDQNALTIVLPTDVIKINEEHKVFINGNPESSELPYQSLDRQIMVTREGPWVNVTTKYGIAIACHEKHFLCTMKLSSWYHGKTQGLLGTFDREVHNDMRKPDGTNATTLIDFMNAYEVTGHTYCKIAPGHTTVAPITGTCDTPVSEKMEVCENLFMNPTSQFREANDVINAGPFFEMCNDLARECRDVCDVAHGYVTVSRDEGIMIDHSPLCDRCEDDRALNTKFNLTKITENTADIVFAISENRIMDEGGRTKTYLNELVSKIEKTLSKDKITENRYSIVAFGGEGVHKPAHQHTCGGKIFCSAAECSLGIDSLEFDGEYQTDAMEALQWAVDLHWRPEAIRMIVLVTEAERQEPFNSSLTYQDVTAMLDDDSIILNVFSEYESLIKDGIEPVLGINYDTTLLTTKRTSADDLVKLKLPKGNYAKMATASKGVLLRLDMLMSEDIDRNAFNAQIAKVFRNSINTENKSITYKTCQCSLDQHQCPVVECKSIRQ